MISAAILALCVCQIAAQSGFPISSSIGRSLTWSDPNTGMSLQGTRGLNSFILAGSYYHSGMTSSGMPFQDPRSVCAEGWFDESGKIGGKANDGTHTYEISGHSRVDNLQDSSDSFTITQTVFADWKQSGVAKKPVVCGSYQYGYNAWDQTRYSNSGQSTGKVDRVVNENFSYQYNGNIHGYQVTATGTGNRASGSGSPPTNYEQHTIQATKSGSSYSMSMSGCLRKFDVDVKSHHFYAEGHVGGYELGIEGRLADGMFISDDIHASGKRNAFVGSYQVYSPSSYPSGSMETIGTWGIGLASSGYSMLQGSVYTNGTFSGSDWMGGHVDGSYNLKRETWNAQGVMKGRMVSMDGKLGASCMYSTSSKVRCPNTQEMRKMAAAGSGSYSSYSSYPIACGTFKNYGAFNIRGLNVDQTSGEKTEWIMNGRVSIPKNVSAEAIFGMSGGPDPIVATVKQFKLRSRAMGQRKYQTVAGAKLAIDHIGYGMFSGKITVGDADYAQFSGDFMENTIGFNYLQITPPVVYTSAPPSVYTSAPPVYYTTAP